MAGAEGVAGNFNDRYGFVYDGGVARRWIARGAIVASLFVLILVAMKRKDVVS